MAFRWYCCSRVLPSACACCFDNVSGNRSQTRRGDRNIPSNYLGISVVDDAYIHESDPQQRPEMLDVSLRLEAHSINAGSIRSPSQILSREVGMSDRALTYERIALGSLYQPWLVILIEAAEEGWGRKEKDAQRTGAVSGTLVLIVKAPAKKGNTGW